MVWSFRDGEAGNLMFDGGSICMSFLYLLVLAWRTHVEQFCMARPLPCTRTLLFPVNTYLRSFSPPGTKLSSQISCATSHLSHHTPSLSLLFRLSHKLYGPRHSTWPPSISSAASLLPGFSFSKLLVPGPKGPTSMKKLNREMVRKTGISRGVDRHLRRSHGRRLQ